MGRAQWLRQHDLSNRVYEDEAAIKHPPAQTETTDPFIVRADAEAIDELFELIGEMVIEQSASLGTFDLRLKLDH